MCIHSACLYCLCVCLICILMILNRYTNELLFMRTFCLKCRARLFYLVLCDFKRSLCIVFIHIYSIVSSIYRLSIVRIWYIERTANRTNTDQPRTCQQRKTSLRFVAPLQNVMQRIYLKPIYFLNFSTFKLTWKSAKKPEANYYKFCVNWKIVESLS